MKNTVYWLWLQRCLGIRAGLHTDEIIGHFQTAKNIYESGDYDRRISGVFTPRQLEKLQNTDLTWAQNVIDVCEREGYGIITPEDGNYPSMLFKLSDLPAVLFVQGDLDCLKNTVPVALVGTRNPGNNSRAAAYALAASLSRSGASVVSGGAVGIDACAHAGALSAGGKTVAVLGCGFHCNYPAANAALRREISERGALVTEYPPDTQAAGSNFPTRNRIISGLSFGTVVVEANEKSGSLITARFAAEQGRDIFAVPGDILSSGFTGANKLIRDGAKPVFSAMDVLEEYAVRFPQLIDVEKVETTLSQNDLKMQPAAGSPAAAPGNKKEKKEDVSGKAFHRPPVPQGIGEDAKKIFLSFEKSVMQADELIMASGLKTAEFSRAVTELELYGVIEPLAGKNYRLTEN